MRRNGPYPWVGAGVAGVLGNQAGRFSMADDSLDVGNIRKFIREVGVQHDLPFVCQCGGVDERFQLLGNQIAFPDPRSSDDVQQGDLGVELPRRSCHMRCGGEAPFREVHWKEDSPYLEHRSRLLVLFCP